MTPETQKPQLSMVRWSLVELPPVCLPAEFTLRAFQPGDAPHWDAIIGDAFNRDAHSAMFERTMRSDPAFRPSRVWFVCRRGKPVATASAWVQPVHGAETGTVHMVGVLKALAGHQLGYWVSLAVMHQMVREGRTQANLKTDDFRIPAIKTYLKLGFAPHIVHANQPARWRKLFRQINRPALSRKWKAILSQPPESEPAFPPNLRQDQ